MFGMYRETLMCSYLWVFWLAHLQQWLKTQRETQTHLACLNECWDGRISIQILKSHKIPLIAKSSMRTRAIAYPSCQLMASVCQTGGEEAVWLARPSSWHLDISACGMSQLTAYYTFPANTHVCMCVCVCVCLCVRACVRACVCVFNGVLILAPGSAFQSIVLQLGQQP